jgi:hypothetical protein
MITIHPMVLVGIGPQARRTVQRAWQCVRERRGDVPAILPIVVDFQEDAPLTREEGGIQHVSLSSPVFHGEGQWPAWLPAGFAELSPAQRASTRAWMRAALFQVGDEIQEFLLESVPHLSSFEAVEALHRVGLGLAGDSRIDVYVIADLGDDLGSGVVIDVAYLVAHVCRQLGMVPLTQGILYLPSATSPAPHEEALAYAALKEIEVYARGHPYDGALLAERADVPRRGPFDGGCCLLDSVNETGYTLQDEEQLITAVCERIHAASFLGLSAALQAHRQHRYQTATLRDKSRIFESFGVAVRYVPHHELVGWAAARLGGLVIGRLLDAPPEADPQKRARAFVERTALRAHAPENVLWQRGSIEKIERSVYSLTKVPISEVELEAREILRNIRERDLPLLANEVKEAQARVECELSEAVVQEVHSALDEAPVGGIPLAYRLLALLGDHVSALQQENSEQIQRHQRELNRSLGTISETYYALRQAVMNRPPWPILTLSAVALLVVPLIYTLRLLFDVIFPLSVFWASIALSILATGTLGTVGLVVYLVVRQKRQAADKHMQMVRERFRLESRPLATQAMSAIYESAQTAIDQARQELDILVDQLRSVSARFQEVEVAKEGELQALAAPGPFRSVLDVDRVPDLVQLDPDLGIEALTQQMGPVSGWLDRCVETDRPLAAVLHQQIAQAGAAYVRSNLGRLKAVDALVHGTPDELQQSMERMFAYAQPLWNVDEGRLRRGKTQRLSFFAADTSTATWSSLVAPLARVCPDLIPVDTEEPSLAVAMNVHLGIPLFALRRIDQYRNHYAEWLWRGRPSLHTTEALSLAPDLLPMRRPPAISPAALFAGGLALGIVARDPDGRYVAPRENGRSIRLGKRKTDSVALMAMEGPACRKVARQIETVIAARGAPAIRALLDEYTTGAPGLEDWEVKGILELGRAYDLQNGGG